MRKFLILIALTTALLGSAVEIIKGTPGEVSWDKVPAMKFYKWKEAGEPPMPTSAQFMYDDNQLYIRIFCTEPNINEALSQPVLKRDGNVWDNDCVEIFIDLCDDSKRIYQFACDIHNVTAELVWNDSKFASGITWNGYWQSRIKYSETSYTIDISIPWRSLGITSANNREIAINLNRYRTIHPWGRYVLAEKTGKLLEPEHYFRFGPLNISAPALTAAATPASAPIAGKNRLDCNIENLFDTEQTGELRLVCSTPAGDKLLKKENISIPGKKSAAKSIFYTFNETGSFPLKLVFTGSNGKAVDLWADSLIFNSPLSFNASYLTSVKGKNCEVFVRSYLPEKSCEIKIAIADLSGKIVAESSHKENKKEFFLTIPAAGLPEGRYAVNISSGEFKQNLKLLIVPALL
ncbi:MAG: hypothetical protein E7054_10660 [Lentisphaerae bacterium]|nr:hypothetical protein [Lentisphaerota bacterium]